MTDMVNRPPHYNHHPLGIECITITRQLNFNRGCAFKYLWRLGHKGDEAKIIEDLEKAIWYLSDEIEHTQSQQSITLPASINDIVKPFPKRQGKAMTTIILSTYGDARELGCLKVAKVYVEAELERLKLVKTG